MSEVLPIRNLDLLGLGGNHKYIVDEPIERMRELESYDIGEKIYSCAIWGIRSDRENVSGRALMAKEYPGLCNPDEDDYFSSTFEYLKSSAAQENVQVGDIHGMLYVHPDTEFLPTMLTRDALQLHQPETTKDFPIYVASFPKQEIRAYTLQELCPLHCELPFVRYEEFTDSKNILDRVQKLIHKERMCLETECEGTIAVVALSNGQLYHATYTNEKEVEIMARNISNIFSSKDKHLKIESITFAPMDEEGKVNPSYHLLKIADQFSNQDTELFVLKSIHNPAASIAKFNLWRNITIPMGITPIYLSQTKKPLKQICAAPVYKQPRPHSLN